MSATAQASLTARTFLLGGGPGDDSAKIRHLMSQHDLFGAVGGLSRLTRQGREAAEEGLASATADLLDIDLGDVAVYGWRTHQSLLEAARRTVQTPDGQEVVQLGSHRISTIRHPTIEILVDGVKVHTFRFELSVTFDIEVAALIVRGGRLTGLRAGDCTVACTLALQLPRGDVELVSEQQKLDAHVVVRFGHGMSLLPADSSETATQAREMPSADSSAGASRGAEGH